MRRPSNDRAARRSSRLQLLLALPLLVVACGGGPEPAATPGPDASPAAGSTAAGSPTPSPLLGLLAEIADRAADENPYLETLTLRNLERELAALPEHATPLDRWKLHLGLGEQQMKRGDVKRAVEHYELAYAELPELRPVLADKQYNQTLLDLAVAWLRRGETENCVGHHTGESCIFPIQGAGVHVVKDGAENAVRHLIELLERLPADRVSTQRVVGIWLLNIAHMALGDFPDGVPAAYRLELDPLSPDDSFPKFENIAPRVGLDTLSLAGGVITEDFTGDGLLDIITTTIDINGPMRYLVNRGDGTFDDRTAAAGFGDYTGGLNCIQADYDNDGWVDLLVLRGAWFHHAGRHPNTLFRNDGDGTFTDVTLDAGLGFDHRPTQTASWADFDRDGDLDLYIGNEATPAEKFPSQLFRNNGDGTFTDIAADAGVTNDSYAKAVIWGDYDHDGWPDLYVSNQPFANRLFRNNGDATFTDLSDSLAVGRPKDSFPVWFWDYDQDGALDLFVAGYRPSVGDVAGHYLGLPQQGERIRLYRGDASGGLRDVAPAVGLTATSSAMGANFGDIDNDGFPDFYLGTGYPDVDALMPNAMLWNRAGERFVDVTLPGGFGHLQKGHAISFADLDNDGDQDVYAQMGGFYPVDAFGDATFLNLGFGNNWLKLSLTGTRSSRAPIGAAIRAHVVDGGNPRVIHVWLNSGGSFGAKSLRADIGLGKATAIQKLEVTWPATGHTQTVTDVAVNRWIAITEGVEGYTERQLPSFELGAKR